MTKMHGKKKGWKISPIVSIKMLPNVNSSVEKQNSSDVLKIV